MKTRPVLPLLTSSLLLFSGGCGFFQGDETADQTQPPTPDQGATPPPPIPLNQVKPLPEVDMAALGLIPPITPGQRRPEIEKGRNNPFALIPVQATLRQSVCQVEKPKEDAAAVASGTPANTAASTVATKAAKPTTTASKPTTTTTSGGSGGALTSGTASISPPAFEPPPLYPNDARAVVVSGIVQIEQKDFAIVKAPGEPLARHVTVGDRLSGGQVIVKSINANRGNAGVVLEQYNQSVTRPVGAAALPPLTPPPPPVVVGTVPAGVTGPVDKDGMVTVTNPDGTTVRFPAAMAEQQTQNTSTRLRTQRPQAQLQRIALRGSDEEGAGYGEIRNLAVLKLDVNKRGSNLVNSTGILCNAGDDALTVRRLTFQVEDPEDNTILDSIQVFLGRTYSIQRGQKLAFDGAAPVFRGRSPEDVIVKLVDWGSDEQQGN